MPDRPDLNAAQFRDELATSTAQTESGRTRMKLRTLLEKFGFTASSRVRQTSLSSAIDVLHDWGYDHKLSGSGVNDYITIWKSERPAADKLPEGSAALEGGEPRPVIVWKDGVLSLPIDPLTFAFRVDDASTAERSAALWHDITSGIWSCRTVCLLVDGSDEMFTLLAGVLAALMRRRALTFRFDNARRWVAEAPEILTTSRLRSYTGQSERLEGNDFPAVGGVYLVRDDPDDVMDDELTAFVREGFLPHTYRIRPSSSRPWPMSTRARGAPWMTPTTHPCCAG